MHLILEPLLALALLAIAKVLYSSMPAASVVLVGLYGWVLLRDSISSTPALRALHKASLLFLIFLLLVFIGGSLWIMEDLDALMMAPEEGGS